MAVNASCIKKLLAHAVITFFFNGKPTSIGPKTLPRSPPFWFLTVLVIPFNKILLFLKDLSTFMIYSISLFFSVSPESISDEILLPKKT